MTIETSKAWTMICREGLIGLKNESFREMLILIAKYCSEMELSNVQFGPSTQAMILCTFKCSPRKTVDASIGAAQK